MVHYHNLVGYLQCGSIYDCLDITRSRLQECLEDRVHRKKGVLSASLSMEGSRYVILHVHTDAVLSQTLSTWPMLSELDHLTCSLDLLLGPGCTTERWCRGVPSGVMVGNLN